MTEPDGISTIDALVESVQRCWPEAASVQLVRRGEPAPDGAEIVEFAAVPNAASVRLLTPMGRRATAGALARYSAALSPKEVAQRLAVGVASGLLGPVVSADRVRITSPGSDHLGALVAEVLGEPVELSMGIGTARANRKPVLGAFDRHGRPVAYVKVGDTAVSSAHVRAEAAALEELGRHRWSTIVVPRLLAHRTWHGMDIVVMEALRPRPWQRLDGRWPIPDAALSELNEQFDGGSAALVDTPWWERMRAGAESLRDSRSRGRLDEALDRIDAEVGRIEVRVGAWHGDFTPWNLARHGQQFLVWDWERFDTGVPVGFDRFHYAVNVVDRARGFDEATVLEGLRLGAVGDRRIDAAVAASYLAALALRYLAGAEQDGGEVVAARAELVLGVLTELSRHLGPTTTEHAT